MLVQLSGAYALIRQENFNDVILTIPQFGTICDLCGSIEMTVKCTRVCYWALYYQRFCDMSQDFQPMASQLSKKAALPLAKILATCHNNVSNTGPCWIARPSNPGGNPITPVECVSLSFRTHPGVLAFIAYILCPNEIEMAFGLFIWHNKVIYFLSSQCVPLRCWI